MILFLFSPRFNCMRFWIDNVQLKLKICVYSPPPVSPTPTVLSLCLLRKYVEHGNERTIFADLISFYGNHRYTHRTHPIKPITWNLNAFIPTRMRHIRTQHTLNQLVLNFHWSQLLINVEPKITQNRIETSLLATHPPNTHPEENWFHWKIVYCAFQRKLYVWVIRRRLFSYWRRFTVCRRLWRLSSSESINVFNSLCLPFFIFCFDRNAKKMVEKKEKKNRNNISNQ